jgi:hypothetical protein
MGTTSGSGLFGIGGGPFTFWAACYGDATVGGFADFTDTITVTSSATETQLIHRHLHISDFHNRCHQPDLSRLVNGRISPGTLTVTTVAFATPEPASLALFGVGLAGPRHGAAHAARLAVIPTHRFSEQRVRLVAAGVAELQHAGVAGVQRGAPCGQSVVAAAPTGHSPRSRSAPPCRP